MTGLPRVVILGGGMAGLAAAWRLTEPGWQRRFESVTVIEAATRLGGKGASTRGAHGRVEEHGLHVWLGHYDNAFRLVRQCYAELDRAHTDPACPIRTWRDAFFPAHDLGLFDRDGQRWTPWVATFSGNDALPGDAHVDNRMPTVAELLVRAGLLVRDFYASLGPPASEPGAMATASWSRRRAPGGLALAETLKAASHQLLVLADRTARTLVGPGAADAISAAFDPLLRQLRPTGDVRARRLHDLLDLVRTVVVGMAVDGMRDERAAYDVANEVDFREWLTVHGAQPSTLRSAIVRGQYDLVFSHVDGDPTRPQFAAGWGAFLSWKLWFDYKGAIFWKMAAGMGDVVFAPLHQALLARGAVISLDHRVVDVIPDRDGSRIAAIDLSVPSDGSLDDPLARINGLPCYLDRAATTTRRTSRLRAGVDFDRVVLAMPPAAAQEACRSLVARRTTLQRLDGLGSVPTHAFQLWLRPDEVTLGWSRPGTTMSAFAKPFDTWASMSHLVAAEAWPDELRPATVAYFCSTHPAATGSATEAATATRRMAIDFLERESQHFWPGARDATTGGFDWRLLAGDDGGTGPARFDGQYWTANTLPSDRYVQSLPGTDGLRLRPDASGVDDLVLAGDWTDSGINAGCIEAAAISGLQAANALLGRSRWDGISGVLLR